jgi:hypothetical protein
MSRYELLGDALLDRVEALSRDDAAEYLFLSESDEFKGRWKVDALFPEWFYDYQSLVGAYRTVSPAKLDDFLSFSKDAGYKVVFADEPEGILEAYEHLHDRAPFVINSDLPNTVRGLFPWQAEGFNRLIKDESLSAGLVIWSTGAGKTCFIASALKWHETEGHPYDLALVGVKRNNRVDMQRKIKALSGLDSFVVSGTPAQRDSVTMRRCSSGSFKIETCCATGMRCQRG